MIIDHRNICYKKRWENAGVNKYNGAYYYSKEIVKNIIPNIKTDRNWITVNIPYHNNIPQFDAVGCDHAIVFIHNNLHPENYEWLSRYHDLILVCGIPETCSKVSHLGKAIYLPLSIDVAYVKRFEAVKTKPVAYVGRRSKAHSFPFPDGTDFICNMSRDDLLQAMAQYEHVYAVGRTALEAKCLGCKLLPYDKRFPDVSIWKVMDNSEAVDILQKELDKIDL